MPGGCFGFGGQQQLVDDLRARVREAEAQAKAEATRHAEAEARMKEALRKLEAERPLTSSSIVMPGEGGSASAQGADTREREWKLHHSLAPPPRARARATPPQVAPGGVGKVG